MAGLLAAMAIGLGLGTRRRLRLRRLSRHLWVPALLLMTAGMLAQPGTGTPPTRMDSSANASANASVSASRSTALPLVSRVDVQPPPAAAASPIWSELRQIEVDLGTKQDNLARVELAIQKVATNAASGPSAEPSGGDQAAGVVDRLLGDHHTGKDAYNQELQKEYDLYRRAAQDQDLQTQLLSSAGAAREGDAFQAVNDDLNVVRTQIDQERTIQEAEQRLATMASLSPSQLIAIAQHQPFVVPLVAPVSQVFGPTDFTMEPPINYNGVFYPHFHTGLDLAAPVDTPVHAAADGIVIHASGETDRAGNLIGYGNCVLIAHPDGFFTLYGHLNSIAVTEGSSVHQGQIIGLEGSTGMSTGPHVHFEVRQQTQFLDPAQFLTGQLQ